MPCSTPASGTEMAMTHESPPNTAATRNVSASAEDAPMLIRYGRMLVADKIALVAAVFLAVMVLCAILGPMLLGDLATRQNLRGRNAPPFDLSRGWAFVLGGDQLGRPLLARIIVASRNTLMVAAGAVAVGANKATSKICYRFGRQYIMTKYPNTQGITKSE